jgi:ribosomal peptide maturation radical SAM protein 1
MTKTILNSDFLISKSEICLVNMPFYSLEFPSIGLGTLKSILQCAHINTSVIHANMLFAEKIGIEKWHTILSYTSTTNVQEWLFSDYLHNSPHNIKKNNEEYFKLILPDLKFKIENGLLEPNNKIRNIDIKKELLLIKKSATKFIDDLAQIILTKEPKVVGCSSVFAQNLASLALLRKVKELAPKVFTILGGPNCSGDMGIAMIKNFQWIDYVFSGEADDNIVPLCSLLISNNQYIDPKKLPYGVFNRDKVMLIDTTNKTDQEYGITKNLNTIPTPNYEDYFTTLKNMSYKKLIKKVVFLESSRGCWWNKCIFCALNCGIKTYRIRDYRLVLRDIQCLSKKYNTKDIFFTDNILPMAYFDTLLPALYTLRNKYSISYEVKSNLQKKHIEQLAKANIMWIQPGIEALNDDMLNLMNKGTSTVININLLKKATENGVDVFWAIMVGFPGENIEWFKNSANELPLFHHLPSPRINTLCFQRYSKYYACQNKYGLKLKPFPSSKFLYPTINQQELYDISYNFYDENYGIQVNSKKIIKNQRKYKLLLDEILLWQQQVSTKNRSPSLLMQDYGNYITVLDTRSCAVAKKHIFSTIYADIIRLTDDPVHKNNIYQKLQKFCDKKYVKNDISEAIYVLKKKKILYEHNQWLLNLLLRKNIKRS